MYQLILTFHVIAATIWTGGHIVLAIGILPDALENQDIERILRFEAIYEKIGLPALVIQVLSGFWLVSQFFPNFSDWFEWNNPISRAVIVKLVLLIITATLAIDARLRLIPALTTDKLMALAWHIIPVTVISVLFVLTGIAFRFGGI